MLKRSCAILQSVPISQPRADTEGLKLIEIRRDSDRRSFRGLTRMFREVQVPFLEGS